MTWTDAKNNRRCDLIDKEIEGTLSADEQHKLEALQTQMLAHRRKVAPLPIAAVRRGYYQYIRARKGTSDEA